MEPLPSWLLESWVEYGVAMIIILVRIFTRTRSEGLKGWDGDDYLILVSTGCFTALLYALQTMYEVDRTSRTDETQQEGKFGFLAWATYVTAVWSLKGCILYYYGRLDMGRVQRKFIKISAFFVFLTYIGVWVCGLVKCLPGRGSTTTRPGGIPGCAENFYVVGITNLVTDLLIFSLPIPLLWRYRPSAQGLILIAAMFGLGIFIMAATCLHNILSLISLGSTSSDEGPIFSWTVREILVAIVVVDAPCLKSLFSSTSWLRTTTPSSMAMTPDPEKGVRTSTGDLSLSYRGTPTHKRRSTSSSASSFSASLHRTSSAPQLDVAAAELSRSNSTKRSRSHSRNRSGSKHKIPPFNLRVTAGEASDSDESAHDAPVQALVIMQHTELEVVEYIPSDAQRNLNNIAINAASKKRTSEGMRRSWGWKW